MGDERWDEAIESFERFLALIREPLDRQRAYRNLGACYLALERYDDALAALDEAARLCLADADMVHSRGVVLACAGRVADAIAEFEQYARRWPEAAAAHGSHDALQHLQRIRDGELAAGSYLVDHLGEQVGHNIEMEDWHLVERKGRRMIAADPRRPEGYTALGVACVGRARYAEALEAFLAAHALQSDDALILFNVGHTYLQLGQPEQAIAWLERTLDRDSESLPALHQMGQAYRQMDRLEEAAAWWRRALQVDPDHRPAQERLYEIGQGPASQEPPLPPEREQMLKMTPIVKARMRRPHVRRVGGVTLTWDGEVGFVLEDADNPRNYTIYAGGPFQTARVSDEDISDLMGLIKQLLRMIDADNTRDIAVLVYYDRQTSFVYQARFARGERVELDVDGQFIVTRVPRLFKMRVDSDLSTPYGDPMQGTLIYMNQRSRPGFMINTLGLGAR
jgi:tetratricopeptide (TPR) repeat protein